MVKSKKESSLSLFRICVALLGIAENFMVILHFLFQIQIAQVATTKTRSQPEPVKAEKREKVPCPICGRYAMLEL